MSWNYRIVHEPDGKGKGRYDLREVYYDEEGRISGGTARAVSFFAWADEGPEGVIASLEMALRDAKAYPVLEPSDFSPGRGEAQEVERE